MLESNRAKINMKSWIPNYKTLFTNIFNVYIAKNLIVAI